MTEEPSFLRDVDTLYGVEFQKKASELAALLISRPRLLPTFLQEAEEFRFNAQQQHDFDSPANLNRLLDETQKKVNTFAWESQRTATVDMEDKKGMLQALSVHQKTKTTKQSKEAAIVTAISSGYINTRFEKGINGVPDWRGVVRMGHDLLKAALMPEADLRMLEAWTKIMIGEMTRVVPPGSILERGLYYGVRDISSSSASVLGMAHEIVNCRAIGANLFDLWDQLIKAEKSSDWLSVHVSIFRSILNIAPAKDYSLLSNLNSGAAKNLYKRLYADPEIREQMIKNYGKVVIQKAQGRQPTPDEIEFAYLIMRDVEQFDRLEKYLQENLRDNANGPKALSMKGIDIGDVSSLPIFGFLTNSPLRNKMTELYAPGTRKKELKVLIDKLLREHGLGWDAFPIAFRDSITGKQNYGYLVTDTLNDFNDQERTQKTAALLEKYRKALETLTSSDQSTEAISMPIPEGDVIFSKALYKEKSRSAFYLDTLIPEEKKREATDYIREILHLNNIILDGFSRIPSLNGDEYDLLKHHDLPEVIRKARLKRSSSGGLEFNLNLDRQGSLFATNEVPRIQGTIDFENHQVNVRFNDTGEELSREQHWIFETILLHLVESSMCVPLIEDQGEERRLDKGGTSDAPSPGHIVHIGVKKKDGAPGNFTPYAEGNYKADNQALKHDTRGLSLTMRNLAHREWHSVRGEEDPRNLTYNRGRDPKSSDIAPFIRKPPEYILPKVNPDK